MRREAKVEAVSDTGGAAMPEGNWAFGEVDITSIPAFSAPSGAASDTSGSSVSSAAWEHAITWLVLVFQNNKQGKGHPITLMFPGRTFQVKVAIGLLP